MAMRSGRALALRRTLLAGYFFEGVHYLGAWRIPSEAPTILAARMGDPLLDALLLQGATSRPLHVVVVTGGRARGLGRWLGGSVMVLPFAAAGDRHAAARHEEILIRCAHLLADGGAIALLAGGNRRRGVEVPSLEMMAARLALKASLLGEAPAIVPVVQRYARRAVLRCNAEVVFGESLREKTPGAGGRQSSEGDLANRIGAALRRAAAPDVPWADLDVLERLRPIVAARSTPEAATGDVPMSEREAFIERVHLWRLEKPVQLRRLLSVARAYFEMVDGFGLGDRRQTRSPARAEASSGAVNRTILMVGGLPAALYGLVFHAAPHALSGWIANRIGARSSRSLTLRRLTLGAVLFPCAYLLQGWGLWRLLGDWRAVTCLLAAPPAGLWWMGYGAAVRSFWKALRNLMAGGWRPELGVRLHEARGEVKSALEPLGDLYR
jgi:hypothetical protein